MYEYGRGVPRDYVEALRWYRKSAEQGNAKGEYAVALMYHAGKGLPQDYSESARWCRKGAEHGNATSDY
jgi:uncharacterized protein